MYDVNGGYEDWAYGASWDKKNIPPTCNADMSFSSAYDDGKEISY